MLQYVPDDRQEAAPPTANLAVRSSLRWLFSLRLVGQPGYCADLPIIRQQLHPDIVRFQDLHGGHLVCPCSADNPAAGKTK